MSMKNILNRIIAKNTKCDLYGYPCEPNLEQEATDILKKITEQETKIKDACYLIELFEADLIRKYKAILQRNQRFVNPIEILRVGRKIVAWDKLKTTKKQKDMTETELANKPIKDELGLIKYIAENFFGTDIGSKHKPILVEVFSYGFSDEAIELNFELEGITTHRFLVVIPTESTSDEPLNSLSYKYKVYVTEKCKNKDGSYKDEWSNSYTLIASDFDLDKTKAQFIEYFKNNFPELI